MKYILACFLVLFSLSGFGQIPKAAPIYNEYHPYKNTQPQAVTLIDSVKNSGIYVMYIDPAEIANVNINRTKDYPNGVIYITLKDHKLLLKLLDSKLLSLKDIKDTYIVKNENRKPIIFLLNKELVTDTTGIRIPGVCLADVTVAQAVQMPYFKTTFPDALIMMITTHPLSNKPYQPEIILRGMANK